MALVCLCLSSHVRAAEEDLISAVMVGVMGESGADTLFYYPTKDQPITPADRGCDYQDVFFHAEDGVKLHGWWMPAKKEAAGTVVYSHGNAGSVAYHLPFVTWLVDAGYNVLLYDYRGYGKSEGDVTKAGLVRDAKAALAYANGRSDCKDLYSFGHSLGGAKSIAAVGEFAPSRLKAVIVDSTFASYQDMAESLMGKRGRKVVSSTYEPVDYIEKFDGISLLIVHGTEDKTIPYSQAKKLFTAGNEPKRLMSIQGANHVNCFFIDGKKYQDDLLKWMRSAVQVQK